MSFHDHFSGHAQAYARARPEYPDALFDYIATLTDQHGVAIDCACGNAQASRGLARHYSTVIANDASFAQLHQAHRQDGVSLVACTAERQALRSDLADVFAVAQAAHWFDFERFCPEVRRVLKPGGAVVLWAYGLARIDPAIDPVVHEFYEGLLGEFWPPERRYIEEAYRTLPFAFPEIAAPSLTMSHDWTLDEFLGYLETWSALQRYRSAVRLDPLPALRSRLAALWNSPDGRRSVVWPLYLRVGRR